MAVIPPNVGPQAQQQQMQMGYTDPSLLQQQLLQSQLLQQQLMMQQMQQQQPAQQPGLLNTISDKAGNALGDKIGDYVGGIFGGGGSAGTGSGGGWFGNLFGGGAAGAAPAAPEIASVAGLGSTGDMASALTGLYDGLPVVGANAGGAAAPVTGMGLTGGAFGSALGLAGLGAGAYLGYQGIKGIGNAINGEDLDLQQQAALALPTFGLSFLSNQFGSGKDKDQLARDAVRKQMKETGFLGPDEGDYNITLPDGTVFDIGKDGDNKLYNVDFNQAGVDGVVRAVDPLAAIMTGGDAKLSRDYAGYFTNASMGGADPLANARALYEKAGLDHSSAYGNVWNLFNAGKLDAARRDGYLDSLDQAFGVGAYAGTGPQAFDANKPGSGGFAPAVPPPAAPTPEIQKPAVKPLAQGTGLLAPLPQNKPTPAGVQMTPGPRPQPMGMAPQAQPIDVRAQLQQQMALGAKPQIMRPLQKPGQTGLLAPLPNSQGQGRGPIRLQR